MDNKEISELMIRNMNNFQNLIKTTNDERYKQGKVLTKKQFFALAEIQKHDKIELKNLSKVLYVSTSSLCILLNKLVEQGYVYRKEDTKDRRNTFYGITEKGQEVVNQEINKFMDIISKKLNAIDKEQREILRSNLERTEEIISCIF